MELIDLDKLIISEFLTYLLL